MSSPIGTPTAGAPMAGVPTVTHLPGGLTVITEPIQGALSAAVAVCVGAGSHYETEAENGACHFLEHMLFKGTASRTAREINAAIDALGGDINATTGRESTCFYARLLPEFWAEALDLFADMLLHSRFDPSDFEREQRVIIEEIRGENENPESEGQELFDATLWGNHPLGRPVAGTEQSVSGISRDALLQVCHDLYTPDNAVVAVAGRIDAEAAIAAVARAFVGWQGRKARSLPPAPLWQPRLQVRRRSVEQAQLFLGAAAPGLSDPDRFGTALLASALGGGTSSRLFARIREDEGLAYNVEAFHEPTLTSGVIGSYAGVHPDQVRHTAELMRVEMARLAAEPMAEQELQRCQTQARSALLLGLESPLERALRAAESHLLLGKVFLVHDVLAAINAVTPDEVQALAARLLGGPLTVAAIGPVRKADLAHICKAL